MTSCIRDNTLVGWVLFFLWSKEFMLLLWTYLLYFKLIWVLSFYWSYVDNIFFSFIYAGFQTAYWPTYWQLSKTSVESLLIWRLTMFALLDTQCLWTPVNPSQALIRSSHSTLHLFLGFVSCFTNFFNFLAMFILYQIIFVQVSVYYQLLFFPVVNKHFVDILEQ